MDLVEYVREARRRGFSFEEVRRHLKRFKLKGEVVDEAVGAYRMLRGFQVGIVVLLVLLFVLVVVLVLQPFSSAPLYAVEVRVVSVSPRVPGNSLMNVVVHFENVGRESGFEVNTQYRVFDVNGVLIASLQETVVLDNVLEKEVSLRIPAGVTVGLARVRMSAWYGNKFASAGAEFVIV